MKKIKLAKRYIEAYKQSLRPDDLQTGLADFIKIATLFLENKKLGDLEKSPLISIVDKKILFGKIIRKITSIKNIDRFFELLLKKHRLLLLPALKELAQKELDYASELMPAKIFLACAPDAETKALIRKKLEMKEQKKINPFFVIDPTLLGGFKAIIGNKIYDASLKNELTKLKNIKS